MFPCKGCHPLRTLAVDGSEVDLGEVLGVLRLSMIILSVQEIYSPGCEIRVLSNGHRYTNVFFEGKSDVDAYRKNVKEIIRFFQLNKQIFIEREEKLYTSDYFEYVRRETEVIERDILINPQKYLTMQNNIMLNMCLPEHLNEKEASNLFCRKLFNLDVNLSEKQKFVGDFLDANVTRSTAQYIAINNVLQDSKIFENVFKKAIKITVHPKPGQVGMIPVFGGSLFPHNGQAVWESNRNFSLQQIKVDYATNFLRKKDVRLKGVVLSTEKYLFSNGIHPALVKIVRGKES